MGLTRHYPAVLLLPPVERFFRYADLAADLPDGYTANRATCERRSPSCWRKRRRSTKPRMRATERTRREDRLAAIRAAKARLEAEQRAKDAARGRKPGQARYPKGGRPYKGDYGEPDEQAQSNLTDPESRIMKTSSEGFQQCYNAQTVVEGKNQLVLATTVTDNAERPEPDDLDGRCGGPQSWVYASLLRYEASSAIHHHLPCANCPGPGREPLN